MDVQFHLDDIHQIAELFWKENGTKKVFAFHGQMGAGKTTFIHALCDAKKVTSTVGSPTFSLVNEYRYPAGIIYHIDLYRIRDEAEALRAGIEDCLYSGDICLVEWPEKAPGIFPEDAVHVRLSLAGDGKRRLQIP
jgi:tRNA threonylcarbamoyladenosine biosynthesis protein TsaE